MSASTFRIFVTVAPGLEALLAQELGGGRVVDRGGVELAGDAQRLWRVLLCSRLAESVRVRLGRPFEARTFDQLEARASRLPWAAYLERGGRLPAVRATCRGSRLYHSGAVEQRVAQVLARRLQPSSDDVDHTLPTVHVRLVDDRAQLSVDASGELLHRRGYRTHVGEAPLRETLAAACLRAAGHESQPLWDPCCGSGTICIEAADGPPGLRRGFAVQRWPIHDAQAFERFRASLRRDPARAEVLGSDLDPEAIRAAEHNAAAAGLEGTVTFRCGDFEEVAERVPRGARIVTNPPFGRRLAVGDRYRRFGALLRRRGDLEPVLALMARQGRGAFIEETGLRWEPVLAFSDQGLAVQLLRLRR